MTCEPELPPSIIRRGNDLSQLFRFSSECGFKIDSRRGLPVIIKLVVFIAYFVTLKDKHTLLAKRLIILFAKQRIGVCSCVTTGILFKKPARHTGNAT